MSTYYICEDTDLTSVANAIRTKGGTSASLTFPAGFVQAIGDIPTGGTDNLPGICANTTTALVATGVTKIDREFAFRTCTTLTSASFPDLTEIGKNSTMFYGCTNLVSVSMPHLGNSYPPNTANSASTFQGCSKLETADLGGWKRFGGNEFNGCTKLAVLVLRNTSLVVLAATSAFTNTPFASGGAGGTIYIPKALYDHLGDGGGSDYKAASNWSTINGYGTITWGKIEGSIYEI